MKVMVLRVFKNSKMKKQYSEPIIELIIMAVEAPLCASGDIEGLSDGGNVSWGS